MKTRKRLARAVLLVSVALLLQFTNKAMAQDEVKAVGQDEGDAQDPSGRVARLSYLQGSVSFRPAGEDDWPASSSKPKGR